MILDMRNNVPHKLFYEGLNSAKRHSDILYTCLESTGSVY